MTEELDRGHVLSKGSTPSTPFVWGARSVFRDDTTGKIQTVMLVYPEEAEISQGKISPF